LYSLAPFCLLMFSNLLLIKSILPSNMILNESENKKKRRKRLTITIIIITFSFLILTTPGAIVSGFLFMNLNSSEIGRLLINILDNISFSYNGLSFIILYLSNSVYSHELKTILSSLFKCRRVSSSEINNSQSNSNTLNRNKSIFRSINVRILSE
jgi:hypothetical protein